MSPHFHLRCWAEGHFFVIQEKKAQWDTNFIRKINVMNFSYGTYFPYTYLSMTVSDLQKSVYLPIILPQ